ncbi:MAG: radical SAM family heme chaperone HemW [Acidobacteria bacterium]|nr:radical SAM family heme chaperone HemW [Acidobacteriota bacterium]
MQPFAWENEEVSDPLGVYISVPFCKAKCSFCNFASDAFATSRIDGYLARVANEMAEADRFAHQHGLPLPQAVDTVYFGGGTPSLLSDAQLALLFKSLHSRWQILPDAEITMECAPGQTADAALDAMLRLGVNRISMGVQSFVDTESAAVGRLHTRTQCLDDIARLRSRGVKNLGIDLICGLPHQTRASWRETLDIAVQSGVDHISIYMLEVDEDSRLGRELIGGGARYRAGLVPHEDVVAEMYLKACELLEIAGIHQYEISNFARKGFQSAHNRKYWTRKPYFGFGLDAHSMLLNERGHAARFANVDKLNAYLADDPLQREVLHVLREEAFEEAVFLGLRLVKGVSFAQMREQFGRTLVDALKEKIDVVASEGLMQVENGRAILTARGRVVSSSVFGELLAENAVAR